MEYRNAESEQGSKQFQPVIIQRRMIIPIIQHLQDTTDALMCSICRKSFISPQHPVGHHAEIETDHQHTECQYHDRSYVSVYNVPSFAAGDFSHNTVNLLMFTGVRLFYEQFTNGICQHDADFQAQHFDCIFPGFYEFSQNCIVVIAGQGKQYPRHKKHDHQTGCITKNIRSLTSGHRLPGASIIFQNCLW